MFLPLNYSCRQGRITTATKEVTEESRMRPQCAAAAAAASASESPPPRTLASLERKKEEEEGAELRREVAIAATEASRECGKFGWQHERTTTAV